MLWYSTSAFFSDKKVNLIMVININYRGWKWIFQVVSESVGKNKKQNFLSKTYFKKNWLYCFDVSQKLITVDVETFTKYFIITFYTPTYMVTF